MNVATNLLVISSLSFQTFEEELNKLFNYSSPLSGHLTRRAEAPEHYMQFKVFRNISKNKDKKCSKSHVFTLVFMYHKNI